MSRLMTSQKILAGCEVGSREAWSAFIAEYTPIMFQLSTVYLPWPAERRNEFWRDSLISLCANNCERLRTFSHQAEREFLVDLRAFLLDQALLKLDASEDATAPPCPTDQVLLVLLKGLPLLHQEIVILRLAGHSNPAIEKMQKISPAIVEKGLERLKADYGLILGKSEDGCLWPAGWNGMMQAVRASKKEGCQPVRQLIRIYDGQTTWYDKDPVEQHRASCLPCMELWISLLEVMAWKREAKPWPREKSEMFLSGLPVQAERKPRKPLLARVFGK
jgi:hypothetical protein